MTSNTGKPMAVPYHFEDYLTKEELAGVPVSDRIFQSYAVRYARPNRNVVEWSVPPLVGPLIGMNAVSHPDTAGEGLGAKPRPELMALSFTLRITARAAGGVPAQERSVMGTFESHTVYKGNSRDLKRRLHPMPGKYIFAPDLSANRLDVPLTGDVRVDLLVGPRVNPVSYVEAGYQLDTSSRRATSALAKGVKRFFSSHLKNKFAGVEGISIDDLQVRRYGDSQGNRAILIFQVPPGSSTAQLVDVEYEAPITLFKPGFNQSEKPLVDTLTDLGLNSVIVTKQYKCDPTSFVSVVGTLMEIDTLLAEEHHDVLQRTADIIRPYAYAMHENDGVAPDVVPDAVQAAFATAESTMFELVGLRNQVNKWTAKLASYEQAKYEVNLLVQKMEAARKRSADADQEALAAKGLKKAAAFFKRKKAAAEKSALKNQLRDLATALNVKISGIRAEGGNSQRFEELRDQVTRADTGEGSAAFQN